MARRAVGADDRVAARVVPGRDGLALVQMPRAAEQRPELHVRVAVDARARCPPVEVRRQERLDHARLELALEVHDVERDAEARRNPPRVVRGIERAAAAAELRVAVGGVVEAHPDPDDLLALLVEQRRGDGRVDAARHGDQHARHQATASRTGRCPSGSASDGRHRSPQSRERRRDHLGRPRRSRPRTSSGQGRSGARHAPRPPRSPWPSARARARSSPSCTRNRPRRRCPGGRARARPRPHRRPGRRPTAGPAAARCGWPVALDARRPRRTGAARRARSPVNRAAVADCSRTARSRAVARPTAPATFSVPARR